MADDEFFDEKSVSCSEEDVAKVKNAKESKRQQDEVNFELPKEPEIMQQPELEKDESPPFDVQ